jgi:hypothetical protein
VTVATREIGGSKEHLLGLGIQRAVRVDLQRLAAALLGRRSRVDPPASGNTALFSTAIEFAVLSSPLPVVAAGDVVQAVSGLASDVPVDWAAAALTLNSPTAIAAATRVMVISKR